MNFPWEKEYEFGIPVIDEQHKSFVAIINKLYDAMQKNEVDEELEKIFSELIDYAMEHFRTEEEYFDKFHYEGAVEHKAKHQEIKDKLSTMQKEASQDRVKLSFDLIDFLEDWLVDHLSSMDAKYVECFKKNGL